MDPAAGPPAPPDLTRFGLIAEQCGVTQKYGLSTRDTEERDKTVRALATVHFSAQPTKLREDLLVTLQNTVAHYKENFSFMERCWHVIKGVFGYGNEWSTIRSLREQELRLKAEDWIANKLKNFDPNNGSIDDILPPRPRYRHPVLWRTPKRIALDAKNKEQDALRQEVCDRILLQVSSEDIPHRNEIMKKILEKGANPNRFYPVSSIDLRLLNNQLTHENIKNVRSATAFGMYVLSQNASSEGVEEFTKRSGGLGKGYVEEVENRIPFSTYLPFTQRRTLPVTQFLKEGDKHKLGLSTSSS